MSYFEVEAEAERRYEAWAGMVAALRLEREIDLAVLFNSTQFTKESLREYYMAEFQDLHDTHGCQYLDKTRELGRQLETTADRLSEVEDERTTLEHQLEQVRGAVTESGGGDG